MKIQKFLQTYLGIRLGTPTNDICSEYVKLSVPDTDIQLIKSSTNTNNHFESSTIKLHPSILSKSLHVTQNKMDE